MRKKLIMAIAAISTIAVLSACNDGTSTTEAKETTTTEVKADSSNVAVKTEESMMTPINAMMDKMKTMQMTGDFDHDYASLMINHHQGAVDLSQMALSKATDAQVKTIAQTMITDHKAEIDELNKFLSSHDTTSAEHKKNTMAGHTHKEGSHTELSEGMNAMMDKMKGTTLSNNVDKDYVTLMLAHHQNAVKLSQDELSHGHHAELKKLAKKMIEDDKKEIAMFEKWLSSMK
jgi:uncharacterized protein (DUF305 family)